MKREENCLMMESNNDLALVEVISALLSSSENCLVRDSQNLAYCIDFMQIAFLLSKEETLPESVFFKLLSTIAKTTLHLYHAKYYKTANIWCEYALPLTYQLNIAPDAQNPLLPQLPQRKSASCWSEFFLLLSSDCAQQPTFEESALTDPHPKASSPQSDGVKQTFLKHIFHTLQSKQDLWLRQWEALLKLGDYYLSHQDYLAAASYYQAGFSLATLRQETVNVIESNQKLNAVPAEWLYQLLPKEDRYSDGLLAKQVCQARNRSAGELASLFKSLCWALDTFTAQGQWDKAWHIGKCLVIWVKANSWKLDKGLLRDVTPRMARIAQSQVYENKETLVENAFITYLHHLRYELQSELALSSGLDSFFLLEDFNQGLRTTFEKCLQSCFNLVGLPPCEYSFLSLGSLARKQACPYSDLEFAIIIEAINDWSKDQQKHIRHYFQELVTFLEYQIILLGESPLPITDGICLPNLHKGFCFDEGGNVPFRVSKDGDKKILFGTIEAVLANLSPQQPGQPADTTLANALQQAGYLAGSKALYTQYQSKRLAILQKQETESGLSDGTRFGLWLLQDHLQHYGEIPEVYPPHLHIKNDLLRLLSFSLNGLSLYTGVRGQSDIDKITVLVKDGFVPESVGYLWQQTLSLVLGFRARAHGFYGQEEETLSIEKPCQAGTFGLNEEEAGWPVLIQEGVLRPLVRFLRVFVASHASDDKVTESKVSATHIHQALLSVHVQTSAACFLQLTAVHEKNNEYQAAYQCCQQGLQLTSEYPQLKNKCSPLETKAKEERLALQALNQSLQTLVLQSPQILQLKEKYEKWQAAVQARHWQMLPDWKAMKATYIEEVRLYPCPIFYLSGLHLLGEGCAMYVKAHSLRQALYQDFIRLLPSSFRAMTVKVLLAYEPLSSGQKYLEQLLINTPLWGGEGHRPLLIIRETEWLAELTALFVPYNGEKKLEYENAGRILIRFWRNGYVQEYLLNEALQNAWLTKAGDFKEGLRFLLPGKRIVVPVKDNEKVFAYAKVYPEMPGVQLSANALISRLSGNVVPHVLCQFVPLRQPNKSYPVLFSQMLGQTLQDVLETTGNIQEVEDNLDNYYFTWHVFETLLLHPEDEKFDNLVAEAFYDFEGKKRYRLLRIDCDHLLIDAVVAKENNPEVIRVQLKSAALCFKQMKHALHPQAVAEFKALCWQKLLDAWLTELMPLSQSLVAKEGALFTLEEAERFFDTKTDSSLVPILFEIGSISELCQRFWRLHAIIDSDVLPESHTALLQLMLPRLTQAYEDALTKETPQARFSALPHNYTVVKKEAKAICYRSQYQLTKRFERSITIVDERKKKSLKTAIERDAIFNPRMAKEMELQGMLYQYQAIQTLLQELSQGENKIALENWRKASPYVKEQILKRLDFKPLSEEWQIEILSSLVGLSLRELHLRNCQALTNTMLRQFVSSMPDLLLLDVSGCGQIGRVETFGEKAIEFISSDLLNFLLATCPQLQKLDISHTVFSQIEFKTLKKLRQLIANDCVALTRISCATATQLEKFSAIRCENLTHIQLEARQLTTLYLTGCNKLCDLKQFVVEKERLVAHDIFVPPKQDLSILSVLSKLEHNFEWKLILAGDGYVGKSQLLNRFANGAFTDRGMSTIGVDFKSRTLEIDGNACKLQVWDTVADRFHAIVSSYLRSAHACMVCFDITSDNSFKNIPTHIRLIHQHSRENVIILLVGLKSDLGERREVSYSQGRAIADELGVAYFEVSAKNDYNVEESFCFAAKLCFKKYSLDYSKLELIKSMLLKKVSVLEEINIIEETDRYGNTPLILAAGILKSEDIVKLLLEKGASVNRSNKQGDTPLMEAVKIRSIPIIKILLENGADVNAKNQNGNSPLTLAKDYEEIVKLLASVPPSSKVALSSNSTRAQELVSKLTSVFFKPAGKGSLPALGDISVQALPAPSQQSTS
jgi:small GTP-binding protein